jgi:hypothetical protein
VWDDPQAAHEQFLAQAADLHAGRESTVSTEEVTVKLIANHSLSYQVSRREAGDIGVRRFEDCRRALNACCKAAGSPIAAPSRPRKVVRISGTRWSYFPERAPVIWTLTAEQAQAGALGSAVRGERRSLLDQFRLLIE